MILRHENHLNLSEKQRKDYQNHCLISKAFAKITSVGNVQPNSINGQMTYSFDFAQMVTYPDNLTRLYLLQDPS